MRADYVVVSPNRRAYMHEIRAALMAFGPIFLNDKGALPP